MQCLGDYCRDLAACTTLDAVGNLFRWAVASEGYSSSACRLMLPTSKGARPHLLFQNWPKNWAKVSDERDFVSRSPVLAEARRRTAPFAWAEINGGERLPAAEREFWGTVREWGWTNGFVVPVHGPNGYFSYVGMGTGERDLDLSIERRGCLTMTAVLAHERCHALYDPPVPNECQLALTERELECMRWVADGKSDWEISMILKISSATVRFHVDRARRKLDAVTRPQAVAKLVARGLLQPQ
jgi:LuxR family quorum sensing-dependent transcriptional regulator